MHHHKNIIIEIQTSTFMYSDSICSIWRAILKLVHFNSDNHCDSDSHSHSVNDNIDNETHWKCFSSVSIVCVLHRAGFCSRCTWGRGFQSTKNIFCMETADWSNSKSIWYCAQLKIFNFFLIRQPKI